MPASQIDTAIFAAMPEELDFLLQFFQPYYAETSTIYGLSFNIYFYQQQKILLAITGIGTTFAAAVYTLIAAKFNPQRMFLLGTAGAIDPALKIGDVVIASAAFEAELQGLAELVIGTPFANCLIHPLRKERFPEIYPAAENLLRMAQAVAKNEPRIFSGLIASSNAFPAPKELFNKIKKLNPAAMEMETSAFYQVSWLLNIPALAVRCISNLLDSVGEDKNIASSDIQNSSRNASELILGIIGQLSIKNKS